MQTLTQNILKLKIEYELNQKNLEVIIYFKNTQLYCFKIKF